MLVLNLYFVLFLFLNMNLFVEFIGVFVFMFVRMIDVGLYVFILKVKEVWFVVFSLYGVRLIWVEFLGVVMLIVCVW